MEITINSKKYGSKVAYFDDEDYDLVSKFNWGLRRGHNNVFYARARTPKKFKSICPKLFITMHALVTGHFNNESGYTIDHINHNGLDNRKSNLRKASYSQQTANTRLHRDSTTGFKGVTFNRSKNLYKARIRVNGELIDGGMFKNIHKAALRYNEMALKYFGDYAVLNKLTEEQISDAAKPPPLYIAKNNTSGYRGVAPAKSGGFTATIYVNGRNQHLGSFKKSIDAAKAYNDAVLKYNKDKRKLNII